MFIDFFSYIRRLLQGKELHVSVNLVFVGIPSGIVTRALELQCWLNIGGGRLFVQVVVSCFPVDHAAAESSEAAARTVREAEVLLRLLRRQTAAAAAEERAAAMARRHGGGGHASPLGAPPTPAMVAATAAIRSLETAAAAYCWQVRVETTVVYVLRVGPVHSTRKATSRGPDGAGAI
jgi:hypothetical protein